jgi:hypothetical protein
MLIMPSCNSSAILHYWQGKYGGLGHLYSPFYLSGKSGKIKGKSWKPYPHLPYALDNGKFICFDHRIEWVESLFVAHCERILTYNQKPLFLVVPDSVGDGGETLKLWGEWESRLSRYRVPLALAVQDGMTVHDVCQLENFDLENDFIFVGGSTQWKLQTLNEWTKNFNKVHCGRVNTWRRLWQCKKAGCISVDGTGYFRGWKADLEGLELFLKIQAGLEEMPEQLSLILEI